MNPATPITIVLAIVAVSLSWLVRPGLALGLVFFWMMAWPEYLRIPMGLAQMSVPRLAALAVITRAMLIPRSIPLRVSWVDACVAAGWVWDLTANMLSNADATTMTFMTGRVFDTVCMYFAARVTIRVPVDIAGIYVPLVWTTLLMGLVGCYEATSGAFLYQRLYDLGAQAWFLKDNEFRYGFLRARGSTGHAIYFGLAMTILTGLLYSMRGFVRSKWLWLLGVAAGLAGALSSLSSGPQIAVVVLWGASMFYYARRLIKPCFWMFVGLCVLVEFVSNRHFFSLVDYLALSSETAWYRTRLIEVAAAHWSEYWLTGVGGHPVHHWGAEIDGRLHADIVNQFIIVALFGGLLSLTLYTAAFLGAGRAAASVLVSETTIDIRMFGFGIVCTLIAVGVSGMAVGLFGPPLLLTYILLGTSISLRSRAMAWPDQALATSSAQLPQRGQSIHTAVVNT